MAAPTSHLEYDVEYLIAETAALFRAETVLMNSMRNMSIDEELRKRREPFLDLAMKIVAAERNSRLDQIYTLLGELRGRT